MVRSNPQSFIPVLEKALTRFIGSVLKTEDGESAIETDEGPDAYLEAIEFLKVVTYKFGWLFLLVCFL